MDENFTLSQFNRLSTSEKYGLLEDHGIYLDTYRLEGPYKVALFALSAFYCEVWLNVKTDQLYKAEAFSSYKKLDPFLQEIDITSIYTVL